MCAGRLVGYAHQLLLQEGSCSVLYTPSYLPPLPSTPHQTNKHTHAPTSADLLGKNCLLVVKNPARHTYLRTLVQPAFSADAIKAYLPAIEALVARHLSDWEAAGSSGVKAYPSLKMLTFDFILQVRLGGCLSGCVGVAVCCHVVRLSKTCRSLAHHKVCRKLHARWQMALHN